MCFKVEGERRRHNAHTKLTCVREKGIDHISVTTKPEIERETLRTSSRVV